MAIARKKKICVECGKEDFIFSKGRCKHCASLEYANTVKVNRRNVLTKKKSKSKKRTRRKTVTFLKKKLWRVFSKYIRLKHANPHTGIGKCITCGAEKHWKDLQCGHGVSRRYNSTMFHEQNNHPQCAKCNILNSGEQYLYSKYVDETYGEGTFESILQLSREPRQFTTYELEELIKKYEAYVMELEKKVR